MWVSSGEESRPATVVVGGWVVPLLSVRDLPWAYDHGRIDLNANDSGLAALDDFIQNVLRLAGDRGLGIFAAGSGLSR